jgi:rhodanese-related sulfurtransferase
MKKLLPLIISALALTACGASGSENSYEQLSMYKALSQMEKEENFILLDVRTIEEYNDGHIPGAINIANETIRTEEIPELPDKDQRIYVYCRSGNRSKQAAKKLVKLGYTNIVEIGGIIDYHGETE